MLRSPLRSLFLATGLLAVLGCQPNAQPPAAANQAPLKGQPIDAPASPSSSSALATASLRQAPDDPAARASMVVEAPDPVARDGFLSVPFSTLSGFVYEADMEGHLTPESHLPDEIAKLDKTKVALSGFLVPIEFKADKVCSMILVRNQLLCCYGQDPKLNEWVFVNIDPPVESIMDVPVTLFGTLYASPDKEDDQVVSLYRMQAEAMEPMR